MNLNYNLFTKDTQAFVYGMQATAVQRMLDFDYVCKRETPSVAAVISPEKETSPLKVFFGKSEVLIPVYQTLSDAAKKHPKADVMLNFASYRSAFQTTMEALETGQIKTVAVIAEGIPERKARIMAATAKKLGKTIIGPATVGGVAAGKFKIGNSGGMIDNIIAAKLYRPGSVGLVTKSGGLSNEMYNIISQNSDGVYEGIAIGGDLYPGSTYVDHLIRFEKNPEIKMMVCLGEVGGRDEYEIATALKEKKLTKPLVAWVTGTCAKVFPTEVQFGHAGAKANKDEETADAKNKALKSAGAIVPNSFDDFGEKIKEVYGKVAKENKKQEKQEKVEIPKVPMDYDKAIKDGLVRRPTNFISTISDDRGEEPEYAGVPMSELFEKGYSIGDVISLLWFKKKLPKYASQFIEMSLMITADHGPAVSGAHNSIVAARAGKDLVSALASGLLTIGPRFGGALNDAAKYFKGAKDSGMSPKEFVNDMKAKGIYIPGIGHRIKSVQNPDKRVGILKEYAKKHFKKTDYLDYALEVEKLTTAKKNKLILNVDGGLAVIFLDLMENCGFSKNEINEIVENGALNGLFVLGRSIGLIGHILDQYRLKQGLYRHPWDDILYLKE